MKLSSNTTLKQAEAHLLEVSRLTAAGRTDQALALKRALHDLAAEHVSPGIHHDAHLRAWLNVFCDTAEPQS